MFYEYHNNNIILIDADSGSFPSVVGHPLSSLASSLNEALYLGPS